MSLGGSYAPPVADFEAEAWGEDPKLVALLGERGAAQFRALFDRFPEAVGVLWAIRDDDGRIVDFSFGYGNPSILRAFRLPAATRDRYTLLEALPRMRGSRAFDAYVRVCDTGEPWVHEVTYDTPFGDGYMLGTWVQRSAKLGDGLVNFLTDVTAQRRMEADLRRYADVPLRVEVSALRDSQEWVVTVRDNGVGVDPEQATRSFGMFSRANSVREGAGIGLAVCRRIVEAHGGRIRGEAADGGRRALLFPIPR